MKRSERCPFPPPPIRRSIKGAPLRHHDINSPRTHNDRQNRHRAAMKETTNQYVSDLSRNDRAGAAITGRLTALAVRSFASEAIPPKTKENQMKPVPTDKDQKRVSQQQIVS